MFLKCPTVRARDQETGEANTNERKMVRKWNFLLAVQSHGSNNCHRNVTIKGCQRTERFHIDLISLLTPATANLQEKL